MPLNSRTTPTCEATFSSWQRYSQAQAVPTGRHRTHFSQYSSKPSSSRQHARYPVYSHFRTSVGAGPHTAVRHCIPIRSHYLAAGHSQTLTNALSPFYILQAHSITRHGLIFIHLNNLGKRW
eukprot:6171917-Pleurochrysis_carterae.AAC.2